MSLTSTALVAEDNDFVRMQMVKFLKDAGYQVKEAIDGTGAIDSVAEKDVDIAIVDVRMQPVDGFGFIKTIRGKNIKLKGEQKRWLKQEKYGIKSWNHR